MQEFEREVIERLVKIETELKTHNEIKAITHSNQHEIIVLNQKVMKLEKLISTYQAWLYTVASGLAIAVITYILKF